MTTTTTVLTLIFAIVTNGACAVAEDSTCHRDTLPFAAR